MLVETWAVFSTIELSTNVIFLVRRRSLKRKSSDAADDSNSENGVLHGYVHICSENNFPTAAGLASSAAGYACLGNYPYNFDI